MAKIAPHEASTVRTGESFEGLYEDLEGCWTFVGRSSELAQLEGAFRYSAGRARRALFVTVVAAVVAGACSGGGSHRAARPAVTSTARSSASVSTGPSGSSSTTNGGSACFVES